MDENSAAAARLHDELPHTTATSGHERSRMAQLQRELAAAHARVADLQGTLHGHTASLASARQAYTDAARTQQALEVTALQQRGDDGGGSSGDHHHHTHAKDSEEEAAAVSSDGDDGVLASREAYLSVLSDKDRECKALQDEVDGLAESVRDLCAAPGGDAPRRLAVARLVSMLDQLRNTLEAKVHESVDGDADVRAQECYKTLQELTRERARALRLLQHKERALRDTVALKQHRVRELRAEACRNLGALRSANERQALTVTERIQRERQALLSEVDRLVVTNDRLAMVLRDTKRTLASSSAGDEGAAGDGAGAASAAALALSGDKAASARHDASSMREAVGASDGADAERARLQERIAAANVELQRLERRTADVKERMDADAHRYTEKMTHLQAKIAAYHDEATRLESENKELKATCDTLAALLQ